MQGQQSWLRHQKKQLREKQKKRKKIENIWRLAKRIIYYILFCIAKFSNIVAVFTFGFIIFAAQITDHSYIIALLSTLTGVKLYRLVFKNTPSISDADLKRILEEINSKRNNDLDSLLKDGRTMTILQVKKVVSEMQESTNHELQNALVNTFNQDAEALWYSIVMVIIVILCCSANVLSKLQAISTVLDWASVIVLALPFCYSIYSSLNKVPQQYLEKSRNLKSTQK